MADASDWEQCKENAQPLKKGRSAVQSATLSLNGFLSQSDKLQHEEQRRAFEERLTQTDSLDEKLDVYVQYYTYMRRNAAKNDLSAARALLERCTKEVSGNEEMKNDPRLLKIWIEYADISPDSQDIFSYMYTNKLGVKHAVFWCAWAFVCEKMNKLQLAEQVYTKGYKRYLAEPRHLIATRYKQFQRRMTRRYLNGDEEVRCVLPEKEKEKLSHSHTHSDTQSQSQSQRRGLSVLSDRPTHSHSQSQSSHRRPPLSSSTHSQSHSHAPPPSNKAIEIFSDSAGSENNVCVRGKWGNIGTEGERRKENTDVAMKWTEAALPEAPYASTLTQTQRAAPAVAPFSIFDDSLCDISTPSENTPAVSVSVSSASSFSAARVDTTQRGHTTSSAAAAVNVSVAKCTPMEESVRDDEEEEGTINTKLALLDIEAIFASPSKPPAAQLPAQTRNLPPRPPQTSNFFSSTQSSSQPSNESQMSFQIFSDFQVFEDPKIEKTVDFGIDVSVIKPSQRESESLLYALDDLDDLVALEDM